MGHGFNSKEEVYHALAERLNKNPVGVPVNEELMEILHRLYTESEALVGSKFPLLPMPLAKIAGLTGFEGQELQEILEGMANKGLLLDLQRRDSTYYMLAPMVVGFFEYTFMRIRDNVDMKELAHLFESYFKSPEVREEFFSADTQMFRALAYENLIPSLVETEVLEYERASEIIRQSKGGALSMCSCRHKASHLGKACGAPLEVCTSFGDAANWLVRRGMGQPATVDELLRVLDKTEKLGLVHLGDNVLNKPAYICHCCGCCCMVLRSISESGKKSIHPSNFIPVLEVESCSSCGICAESCHIRAISMNNEENDEKGEGDLEMFPSLNLEICIGCGVCASVCPTQALTMSRRSVLYLPPENKREQFTCIAREKGRGK
jgi:ferredoxin